MQEWMRRLEFHWKKILLGAIVCVCLSVGISIFQLATSQFNEEDREAVVSDSSLISSEETAATTTISSVSAAYVDLKGAVTKPGMYPIQAGTRLLDVVQRAGGFLSDADTTGVNYSQLLEDQMIIYIPKVGENPPEFSEIVTANNTPSSQSSSKSEQININTADAQELQKLTGVGQKRAEDIIRYREENGSFKQIEDIKNVSGIGEKVFENIKEMISI